MSNQRTLLIIDPSEDVRKSIKDSMRDLPCRFVELEESSEAVMQLAIEGPNMVVISAEQKDGDGVELLRNIKAFDWSLPVIVLMGQPTKEKIVDCKKAGSLDILLRPPDYERLATRIKDRLWPDNCLENGECELTFEAQLEKHKEEERQAEEERGEFVESIPKGAEMCNINDTCAGMRLAKALILNDIVYGDKGLTLSDALIKQLNKMGVPEVCVYTDIALKKKVQARKEAQAKATMIKTSDSGAVSTQGGARKPQQEFSTVKRAAVRIDVDEETTIKYVDAEGQEKIEAARVVDMSAGGCGLLTLDKMEKGCEITMTFFLDKGSFAMQNVRGIVRHCVKKGTEEFPYRNGIYFNSITEKFRENMITVLFKIEREAKQKELDKKKRATLLIKDML